VVDAARRLKMPVMNIHLAADIIGRRFFIEIVNRVVDGKTTTVEEVMAKFFATHLARLHQAGGPSARI